MRGASDAGSGPLPVHDDDGLRDGALTWGILVLGSLVVLLALGEYLRPLLTGIAPSTGLGG